VQHTDRIIVAFANPEAQRRIVRILEQDGCVPAGVFYSGADVIRAVRKLGSAIVICGFKLRDMTATELALSLKSSAVFLAVTSPVNLDFCEGENLFKLSTPVSRADFFSTLQVLRQMEERTLHPPVTRRREDEQKLVLHAKQLLMDVNRMTEDEAHRFLQKRSMDTGLRMVETARLIVESYTH